MLTFDPAKRDWTFAVRGLRFEDADEVFRNAIATLEDRRRDYGEARFVTAGWLGGRLMIVVWTEREPDRHVISMRKANEREQKAYTQRP